MKKVLLFSMIFTSAMGELKVGKVGSIETEAEALQACVDLHAAGPSKVLIGRILAYYDI